MMTTYTKSGQEDVAKQKRGVSLVVLLQKMMEGGRRLTSRDHNRIQR